MADSLPHLAASCSLCLGRFRGNETEQSDESTSTLLRREQSDELCFVVESFSSDLLLVQMDVCEGKVTVRDDVSSRKPVDGGLAC